MFKSVTAFIAGALLVTASPVFAQTPVESGNLSGETVTAAARLAVEDAAASQATVPVERRRNDSVLNGAIIGAAVAVGAALPFCRAMEPWDVCLQAGPLVRIGALGAAIGIGVDALIRKREVVHVPVGSAQISVAPVAARGAGGVRIDVRF